MLHSQFDGASSLLSGVGIMRSQVTQAPDPSSFSPAKNRGAQGALPLTVKQVAEAYYASDDKSVLTVNGSEVTSVRLLGLVMNKVESDADVSFTLDDGTGRIDINRWINEFSDADEVAAIRNGMYVRVNAHMKGFQGKRHAFSVRYRKVFQLGCRQMQSLVPLSLIESKDVMLLLPINLQLFQAWTDLEMTCTTWYWEFSRNQQSLAVNRGCMLMKLLRYWGYQNKMSWMQLTTMSMWATFILL